MTKIILEPPSGLLEKILKRIGRERRILALERVAVFSVVFLISVASFIPVSKMLWQDFSGSGFIYFLSLIFTDFSIVMVYWQNFTLQLLQTLPAISLALFLVVALAFLQSIRSLTKDFKIIIKYV